MSEEEDEYVEKLVECRVFMVFFLELWHEIERQNDVKVHVITSLKDIVMRGPKS